MHIFSESSQNFMARSKFLFPHFLSDSSISLCRVLNVPFKKIKTTKKSWAVVTEHMEIWLHKVCSKRTQLESGLVLTAPSPENGSEDTAHPPAYRGQSFWTQGYFPPPLPPRWSDSSQHLLPRHCEAWLQLRLQNHMFLLFTNGFNLDPMPKACHGFHQAESCGKAFWSLISLQSNICNIFSVFISEIKKKGLKAFLIVTLCTLFFTPLLD